MDVEARTHLDWLPILIAAAVYYVLGYLWYSPWLFGHRYQWSHDVNWSHENHPTAGTFLTNRPALGYIAEAIIAIFIAFVLAFFQDLLGIDHPVEGLFMAFWIWLGFLVPTHFSSFLWGRRSFEGFIIFIGFLFVSLLLMSALIAYIR